MAMLKIALFFAVIFCTQDLLLVHGCVAGVVRLSGGSYSYEGRVEICVNNTWGTVCDDSFDFHDATVVCHQLGYTSAYTYYSSAYYGQGSGPIWLDEVSCTGTEFSLLQCTNYGIGSHDCSHYEDVSVRCSGSSSASCVNGDVRLVGGSNSSSGRVEVCANNVWGTVCDDYWNNVDAAVVCRMLNFTGNAYGYHNAHFGQGTGSILLDNVRCIGTEYSVFSCAHNTIGTNDCSHYEDASVVCSSSSYSDCVHGQLRLVNGANQYEGRVEICINNVWGTVCDDYWDTYDARVACRQLGYPTTNVTAYSYAHFGAGTGSILLDNVNCNGYESSLLSCTHNPIGTHNCAHSEDAGVSCHTYSSVCINNQVRLVGGVTQYEGRVELCRNNAWGTICSYSWDNQDAQVVCRQLGYPTTNATAFSSAYFGSGTGSILYNYVGCTGHESSLASCSHSTSTYYCSHYNDAGVGCYAATQVCAYGQLRLQGSSNPREGRVEICINNNWGTVCDDGWTNTNAEVACRQLGYTTTGATYVSNAYYGSGSGTIYLDDVSCVGTEYSLLQCNHRSIGTSNCVHSEDVGVRCTSTCTNGHLRLVNGANQYEGRVEICINNVWGTVCDDYWDTNDARVVCRQLGYPTTNVTAYSYAHFGAGTGSILLDNVNCNGYESSLLSCNHNAIGNHNCAHSEDAGVSCHSYVSTTCTYGHLRLVNGLTSHEGRVEICINNNWGTVCDDSWDRYDARVVCRQLGYSTTNAIAYSYAFFGQGSGSILLDDVNCYGYESNLLSCNHSPIGTHNCGHSEDAGVSCSYTSTCTNGQLRLRGSYNRYEGRVEICYNNTWGTVCDDYWDTNDARVVCRQLGYSTANAIAYSNAHFGSGTGSILLDDVNCNGYESNLLSCYHSPIGTHNCGHSEDAGVSCSNTSTCTNGQLRLRGGYYQYQGRVEICYNNVWGTVCDDYWDTNDARVVCRQLGYSSSNAIAYSNAYFGSGTGSILLDNVNCNGYESYLLSCSHNPIGSNDCGHSEDAGVSCYGASSSVGAAVGITIAAMIVLLGCMFCLIVTPIIIGLIIYRKSRRNSSRRQQNTSQSTPASTAINVSEPDDVNIRVPPTGSQGIAGSGGVHYHPVTQVDTEYMVTMETLPRNDLETDDETCILLNQADS